MNILVEESPYVKYDDLAPIMLIVSRVGANAPTLAQFKDGVYQYTFDATNDVVYGATEVTHSYKEGTDIEVHVHWATNGLEATEKFVKWSVEYAIANGNEVFGTTKTLTKEISIPAGTADRTHFIHTIGIISGADVKIGTYILIAFKRIASTGTAPTADPFGIAVGFHTAHDSMGSASLYTK